MQCLLRGGLWKGIEKSNVVCKNLAAPCFDALAPDAEMVQRPVIEQGALLLRQEMLI
jgi:hypothetical protein